MCCGSKCHTVRLQNWKWHQEKPHTSLEQWKITLFEWRFFCSWFRLLLWFHYNRTDHMNTNFWWFHWVDTQIYKSGSLVFFEWFKLIFKRQYLYHLTSEKVKRKREEAFIQLKSWLSRALWSMMTLCF